MAFQNRTLSLLLAAFAVGAASAMAIDLTESELSAKLEDKSGVLYTKLQEVERTIAAGDSKLLAEMLDGDAMLLRATAEIIAEDTVSIRNIFMEGTKRAWAENSPANDYCGTHFKFMRVRTIKERAGVLFRSENEQGSLNYYLFTLAEPKAGEFRITDIFTVGLNEFLTDSLRRTYRHLVASFTGASEYSPLGKAYVENLQLIANMNRAMRQGQYAETLRIWQELPYDVAHERSVLMLRLDAAERVSPEDRVIAMNDWLKTFPDEMELPLKIADFYIESDRWADAERVLKEIVKNIGGDSRLLFQLGQVASRRKADAKNGWTKAAELKQIEIEESAKK